MTPLILSNSFNSLMYNRLKFWQMENVKLIWKVYILYFFSYPLHILLIYFYFNILQRRNYLTKKLLILTCYYYNRYANEVLFVLIRFSNRYNNVIQHSFINLFDIWINEDSASYFCISSHLEIEIGCVYCREERTLIG